jgi:uncharacterized membrane protein YeaQ/YmgE (transglycosylase-associated protein family)
MMSIIGWIILGLIAGFIASKIVNKTGQGFLLDAVIGIVGAIVGGFIFDALGGDRNYRLQSLQHDRRHYRRDHRVVDLPRNIRSEGHLSEGVASWGCSTTSWVRWSGR